MADATMLQVFKFFETSDYKISQFRVDWNQLSDQDKSDLKKGIGDGTLTY